MKTDIDLNLELLIERQGSCLRITLNRPAALNALTGSMLADLRKSLLKASGDSSLRSIVITGAGKGFCVGADLAQFQKNSKEGKVPSFRKELEDNFHPIARAIRSAPQIVIARVSGPCAGAGMALALCCDLKYALEDAPFVAAFAKVGLGPDTGSSFLVSKALGYSKALEYFLLKDKNSAQYLEEMGLINEAFNKPEEMDEAILSVVKRLEELPPQAVVLTKRALMHAAESDSFENALQYEAAIQEHLGKSGDHAEGMAAFLEKRKPVFKGI